MIENFCPKVKWEFPTEYITQPTPSGNINYILKTIDTVNATLIVAKLNGSITGYLANTSDLNEGEAKDYIQAAMDNLALDLLGNELTKISGATNREIPQEKEYI